VQHLTQTVKQKCATENVELQERRQNRRDLIEYTGRVCKEKTTRVLMIAVILLMNTSIQYIQHMTVIIGCSHFYITVSLFL
jgi:hypothetical protein